MKEVHLSARNSGLLGSLEDPASSKRTLGAAFVLASPDARHDPAGPAVVLVSQSTPQVNLLCDRGKLLTANHDEVVHCKGDSRISIVQGGGCQLINTLTITS